MTTYAIYAKPADRNAQDFENCGNGAFTAAYTASQSDSEHIGCNYLALEGPI